MPSLCREKAGENIAKGGPKENFFENLFKYQRGYTYIEKTMFQF
jgi:hypothetical protein